MWSVNSVECGVWSVELTHSHSFLPSFVVFPIIVHCTLYIVHCALSSYICSSKNKASDKEMQWVGRIVVLCIAVIALLIAANPESASIMGLVSNAWGLFGAAIGPSIILSLFWKRFNFAGAIAGITVGALADICWLLFFTSSNIIPGSCVFDTQIYEILPGFVCGMLAAVIATLATKKPCQRSRSPL